MTITKPAADSLTAIKKNWYILWDGESGWEMLSSNLVEDLRSLRESAWRLRRSEIWSELVLVIFAKRELVSERRLLSSLCK